VNPIAEILAKLQTVAAGERAHDAPRCAECQQVPVTRPGLLCSHCLPRAGQAHRSAALRAARESIPPLFRELDADTLRQRTGLPQATLDQARDAIGRPRVVLAGAAGRGKTSLACWMLRQVIDAGAEGPRDTFRRARWARFVDAARLCRAAREHPLGEGEPPMLAQAQRASVLVLDDVGSELEMRMPTNPVVDVLRERHAAARATWVTTFLPPDAFEKAYGSGTTRRVFEGATILWIGQTP
jgi:DNA replication protein DnaC